MEHADPQRRQVSDDCQASPPEEGAADVQLRDVERRCAVSRQVRPKDELIRFVAGPGDKITPDLKGNLPGRGVWVSCQRSSVEEAIKRSIFHKSLKKKVIVPEDIAGEVDRLLLDRVRNALSIAHKAGLVTAGFTKTEQSISRDGLAALLHAFDGAVDGSRKLDRLADAIGGETGRPIPRINILNIEEMSLALGRSNVVHAAIRSGGAASAFLAAAARLERYRSTRSSSLPHEERVDVTCGTG